MGDLDCERDDFWAATRDKHLNFVQHVVGLLKVGGTAAVVVPVNALFEAGAGETSRRRPQGEAYWLLTGCGCRGLVCACWRAVSTAAMSCSISVSRIGVETAPVQL